MTKPAAAAIEDLLPRPIPDGLMTFDCRQLKKRTVVQDELFAVARRNSHVIVIYIDKGSGS